MALFFIYAGRKGSGLESTLAPYELARELDIDARLFFSKDNERKALIEKIYPEAQFFNFTSPLDILKMKKAIGSGWSFFTMISPKMIPLFYSLSGKKIFYFHATFETSMSKPSLGGWAIDSLHDAVIRGSTLTLATKAPLAWQIKLRLDKDAETFIHPPFILRPGFFAAEKPRVLPFDRYFLYFGDVDREAKGVKVLVKALEEYPQIKAIVAGRRGNLPKLGNLVHLKGWIDEGEMHYMIKNAEAVVLPYLVPAQFSGCLALSFHFRTPVIASNTSTFEDWIEEDKTGWLFPSGDHHALGKKMLEVWEGKRKYSKDAIAKKELEMKEKSKKSLKGILEKIQYTD